jgi:hypothetical protein
MWIRPVLRHEVVATKVQKVGVKVGVEEQSQRQKIVNVLLCLAGFQLFVTVFLMRFFSY